MYRSAFNFSILTLSRALSLPTWGVTAQRVFGRNSGTMMDQTGAVIAGADAVVTICLTEGAKAGMAL